MLSVKVYTRMKTPEIYIYIYIWGGVLFIPGIHLDRSIRFTFGQQWDVETCSHLSWLRFNASLLQDPSKIESYAPPGLWAISKAFPVLAAWASGAKDEICKARMAQGRTIRLSSGVNFASLPFHADPEMNLMLPPGWVGFVKGYSHRN